VFLQPQLEGHYPADVVEASAPITDFGFVLDGDLAAIRQPIDGLGINYYSPNLVAAATPELLAQAAAGDTARVSKDRPTPFPGTDLVVSMPQEGPYTDMGWRIEPGAFTELLVDISSRYPTLPIMVTENGAAYPEGPGPDGRVHDDARTDYLRSHIGAVLDAIEQGANVRGYYVWSLLDNFEWAFGYDKRFGIVHVDYDTQVRTIKDSGHWYADVIRAHGLPD
jgi:beta-glucosidase